MTFKQRVDLLFSKLIRAYTTSLKALFLFCFILAPAAFGAYQESLLLLGLGILHIGLTLQILR